MTKQELKSIIAQYKGGVSTVVSYNDGSNETFLVFDVPEFDNPDYAIPEFDEALSPPYTACWPVVPDFHGTHYRAYIPREWQPDFENIQRYSE